MSYSPTMIYGNGGKPAMQGGIYNVGKEWGKEDDHRRELELLKEQLGYQGELTEAQLNQQLELARINGDYSLMEALLSQGGITDEQRNTALGRFNNPLDALRRASGTAEGFTKSGGFDDGEWDSLNANYGDVRNRLTQIADNGALRADEYGRIRDSSRQDVMDMYKTAAESGFNSRVNPGAATFAGMAVMAEGAREGGANMARVTADLDKFQASSRMDATGQLRGVADSQGSLMNSRANNRLAALAQQGSLAGQMGSIAGNQAEIDMAPELGANNDMLKSFMGGGAGSAMSSAGNGKGKQSAMGGEIKIPAPKINPGLSRVSGPHFVTGRPTFRT